ncbi:hypothetical protein ACHAWX_002539 [Stephanocyclus meneghinianus]
MFLFQPSANPSLGPSAFYDQLLGAPRCDSIQNECSSGSLLVGRGTMSGGHEVNAPNVIDGCIDGNAGTYKIDESIERIVVRSGSVNRTGSEKTMTEGGEATITASVWVWSTSDDYADFYYTVDVYNPNWQYIGTVIPAGTGYQDLAMPYTLPLGASAQAVRVNFRYLGSTDHCTGGGYDDRDDLIFSVLRLSRFVKISVSGYRTLNFAEVQVFDKSSINRALATRGAIASQSTTYLWGETLCPASIAIDGITNSSVNLPCEGLAHTDEGEYNPWWMVDLSGLYDVSGVVIWNRMNCCSDRLSRATVSLLDDNSNVISQVINIGDTTSVTSIELNIGDFRMPAGTNYGYVGFGACSDANGYVFNGIVYNESVGNLATCADYCDSLYSIQYWNNHNGMSFNPETGNFCVCHFDSPLSVPLHLPHGWSLWESFTVPNIGHGIINGTIESSLFYLACYRRIVSLSSWLLLLS